MKAIAPAALALAILASAPAHAEAARGPRIEAKVGYDSTSIEFVGWSVSPSGFAYGGEVGYDLPVSKNISLGADAEITGTTTQYRMGDYKLEFGRDLYAGGRITVAATRNVNLYAKVGYANLRSIETLGPLGVTGNGDGVRFGGGAQYLFDKNFYASVEYRYTNYQANVSRNQVLTGIGYRF
ncbi:outer membrane protein [Novosphingobium sediminicola]|uniref:Outer membrane immunogenic protein n=1 Tax=Novosphingobium sediminicola TaxID=563162 RepID=A0A7W6G542_9SPHN|nr:porin family protein [Novosphingobium sediminicola]MBB3953680.1 outer membrane immunogenic protein [Novosphingobium sediminicola]